MKVLVWQWSRLGGPPRFGVLLARALAAQPEVTAALSLSARAQLSPAMMAESELLVDTYTSLPGFIGRAVRAPLDLRRLVARVRAIGPDVAVCAQPGPLDLLMAAALRRLGIPFVVLVHDAELHPGDGMPLQMPLQRALCRSADAVGALTGHVATVLAAQGLAGTPARPLIRVSHPPLAFDMPDAIDRAPGPRRLLCFGRLLAYKGLDLLQEALHALGPRGDLVVRIVGTGPETPVLEALRALPNVAVENRWVPDAEIGDLLGWSDALILPYREASQSGVAAAALAAGRSVIATRVGGLVEQLGGKAGALMCEPDGASLAEAIRALLAEPPGLVPAIDAGAAWNDMAATLVQQICPVMRRRKPEQFPALEPSARAP